MYTHARHVHAQGGYGIVSSPRKMQEKRKLKFWLKIDQVKNCTGQNLIRLAARVLPESHPIAHDLSVLSLCSHVILWVCQCVITGVSYTL